jgi:hypothetical protein
MTELKPKPKQKAAPSSAEIICNPLLIPSQFLCASRGLDQKVDSPLVAAEISKQLEAIHSGDVSTLETRLLGQVMMLESFAADCLLKAQALVGSGEIARHTDLCQTLAHLGLRCQNQSRQAAETLRELRSPKRTTTFVKTQNNQHNEMNLLISENLELRKKLEASTNAEMDSISAEASEPTYEQVEGVGI